MCIVGVIAEYNPFHNGHQYQLNKIRRTLGAEYVIAVMSGDFVQRGAPALFSKYDRTRMALAGGVDLVVELPVAYSTASAERFAKGGIRILERLGVTDMVCFGCESCSVDELSEIARLLSEEPPVLRNSLRLYLGEGLSFPSARIKAVAEALPGMDPRILTSLLSEPNNILAVEYCKALIRSGSRIRPVPLARTGGAYHDPRIGDGPYASASAIRREILHHRAEDPGSGEISLRERLQSVIPACVLPLVMEAVSGNRMVTENDLDLLLCYRLLKLEMDPLDDLLDVPPDLMNRIRRLLPLYQGFDQFCGILKTKNRTCSSIRRALLHILLELHPQDEPDYIRVLGFRRDSTRLLGMIREQAGCEVIIKPSRSVSLRGDRTELFASELYRSLLCSGRGFPGSASLPHELQQSPVIWQDP